MGVAGYGGGPTGNHINPQNSFLPPGGFSSIASSSLMPSPSRDDNNTGDDGDGAVDYDMPFAVEDDVSVPTGGLKPTTNATLAQQASRRESNVTSNAPGKIGGADNNFSATESLSHLGSSAAVASFAQKCAPSQYRLKLFESGSNASHKSSHHSSSHGANGTEKNDHNSQNENGSGAQQVNTDGLYGNAASNLTEQLAAFRDFGASLSLVERNGSHSQSYHPHQSSSASEDGTGTTSSGTPIPMQS